MKTTTAKANQLDFSKVFCIEWRENPCYSLFITQNFFGDVQNTLDREKTNFKARKSVQMSVDEWFKKHLPMDQNQIVEVTFIDE